MIIDTHTHLDNEKFYDDIENIILNAQDSGVDTFIIPGANLDDLPRAVMLSEKYKNIFFAVGVHPYDIDNYDIKVMEKYVDHPKCVAVGECGLDYFRLPDNEDEKIKNITLQKEIFIEQIEFAKRVKKPLIVHIRDASSDSQKILLDTNSSQVGGVLHCFNADNKLLSLADFGFYFGIGGVITFKNAKKLVDIISKIPKEKLLLETDSPYLTPHPNRGKRNEPKYINLVSKKVSELLNISVDEINILTTKNARKLFNLSM